jgi:CheY-like chemotaxis protein
VIALGTEQGRLAEARASHATPRKYGILVVDDEACVRDILNLGMRQRGFAVSLAANGQEALDLYRRHRSAIDVVLMDVRMPGLSGPQTLAGLQELNPQIRCCFMSGDFGSHTEAILGNSGAATVFSKPFRLHEVIEMLWELAERPEPNPVQCVNARHPQ